MDASSIVRLPLPPTLRSKLQTAGFTTISSLHGLAPLDLARDARISPDQALSVLKLIPSNNSFLSGHIESKTAWDLLCYERQRKRITTSCKELDEILGGGVLPREITEICGVPGIGKTQLGMQLAINVQIPSASGGVGGQAVYIDTEGSFMLERVLQMAEASIARLEPLGAQNQEDVPKLEIETLLSNIFYFRVHDYVEQLATVNTMQRFLDDHRKVKIIIIDSVTFHFRQDFRDMALRTRLLNSFAQKLMSLAEKHDLAVVLINQVTQRLGGELVPALGESWSHACTNRLILYWLQNTRHAFLAKSSSLPNRTAMFSVTSEGICSNNGVVA